VKARGRLYRYDDVQRNNADPFPDPKLPTYEGLQPVVEGEYTTWPVSVPAVGIDYVHHLIDGFEVDPATVEVLP
jgi:hypothetical protein